MSHEVELYLLALLLYLYDSSVRLYVNEAVLIRDGRGRWSSATGWSGFLLGGRTLCVLNPFTPQRAAFRLSWNFAAVSSGAADRLWSERAPAFRVLAWPTLAAGMALFMLLPLGLFTGLAIYAIVPALCMLYGAVCVGLFRVRRDGLLAAREALSFWSFAFECLACPPFGVNMLRRITLTAKVAEQLPMAGVRLLDAAAWTTLQRFCVGRVEDAMQTADAQSEDFQRLEAQRRVLQELT